MTCPRCEKEHSYALAFKIKDPRTNKNVRLDARVCKVCEYIWADDEQLLKTARAHLKELTKWHYQQPSH